MIAFPDDLVWDAPIEANLPMPRLAMPRSAAPVVQLENRAPKAFVGELTPGRIRDRYIEARFPGVAKASADLEDAEKVIKAARLYFDEYKFNRALELLELAIMQSPGEELFRLAQLEIAFLRRDAALYVVLARRFRVERPASGEWAEVARLGRALLPAESLFGSRQAARAHDHYGPWPHTPNWIQAPWDLTAESLGADFHRAMTRRAIRRAAPPILQAA